jgi:hypothetical protein
MIVQLLSDLEQGAAGQPARGNSETDKIRMAGLWLKENQAFYVEPCWKYPAQNVN